MPNVEKKTAVFLDRDGTIIVDKHYLGDPGGVEIIGGAGEAIGAMAAAGYSLFLFSNQSGVARGIITMDDVWRCNGRMIDLLCCGGEIFTEICVAPEGPNGVQNYRKPSPKFIVEMIEKYGFDPSDCYMVGDKESDVLAGINANVNPILISNMSQFEIRESIKAHPESIKAPPSTTEKSAKTSPFLPEIRIFPSLLKFSDWLIGVH